MNHDMDAMIRILWAADSQWRLPVVTEIAMERRDPYRVLISTIISLRNKDEVTAGASERLFKMADTPQDMVLLETEAIRNAIYPAVFYVRKAQTIKDLSKTLVDDFNGQVPDTLEKLLELKGVGRKTANLVLIEGFCAEGICVDTHVHRIANRWGYVSTLTPDQTEFALRDKLDRKYWMEINRLLVPFGKHVCKPISPLCSECPLHNHCMRVGVIIHR